MGDKVVDPRFAKDEEYRGVIEKIQGEGKCPFCPENFKYHKHPILQRCGDWFITKISWPYPNTKYHFIIICEKHKEKTEELNADDMASILFLWQWAVIEFDIPGCGLAMRAGDTKFTGATVCHLHAHVICPIEGQTVNFPIG